MSKIRLGCSGWSYDEWIGPLYRDSKESKLAAYSRVFDIAEINSTFYRNPEKGMVLGWRKYTPDGFLFTAKIPQKVTHDKLLDVDKGIEDDLKEFCALMEPLSDAGKLGCLLVQLPPRLRFERENVKRFYEALPDGFGYAVEFRNRTWLCEESYKLLEDFDIAYTIVDEPLLPPDVKVTSKLAYIRWHGRGKRPWYDYHYEKEDLKKWVPDLQRISKDCDHVFGFFNNHFHGYAPENCLQVLEMLGALTSAQNEAKKRIEDFREGRATPPRPEKGKLRSTTLADFGK